LNQNSEKLQYFLENNFTTVLPLFHQSMLAAYADSYLSENVSDIYDSMKFDVINDLALYTGVIADIVTDKSLTNEDLMGISRDINGLLYEISDTAKKHLKTAGKVGAGAAALGGAGVAGLHQLGKKAIGDKLIDTYREKTLSETPASEKISAGYDVAKKYMSDKASEVGKAIGDATSATKDYVMTNPGKTAAIGAGVIGAGALAKHAYNKYKGKKATK
jgi:ElaB/YqjD/DUF883 family membrane-anchored ribosome-binding protein